jgi:hypothetical protein
MSLILDYVYNFVPSVLQGLLPYFGSVLSDAIFALKTQIPRLKMMYVWADRMAQVVELA